MIHNAEVAQWLRDNTDREKYDLGFADPPFGIGQKYEAFDDSFDDYGAWVDQWLDPAWELIRPGGVLVLHGSRDVTSSYLQPAVHSTIAAGEMILENEIIWFYTFGQNRDTNWVDSFCRALILRKPGSPRIWNPEANLVKSARLAMGDVPNKKGGFRKPDNRIKNSKRGGWVVPSNTWTGEGFVRIQGNNPERWDKKHGALVDHPNQLPQLYLARFVRAYTVRSSRVLDLFCGSGGMPLVCRHEKRHCDSIEIAELTARSAQKRVTQGFVSI